MLAHELDRGDLLDRLTRLRGHDGRVLDVPRALRDDRSAEDRLAEWTTVTRALGVHIGARLAELAGPDEVLVTSTVRDLMVGSGIEFDDRGHRTLKGVPGRWHLLAVREPVDLTAY